MASWSAAAGNGLREEESLTQLTAARRCRLLVALVSLVGSSKNDGGGGWNMAEGENVTWRLQLLIHLLYLSPPIRSAHQCLSVRSRSVSDA